MSTEPEAEPQLELPPLPWQGSRRPKKAPRPALTRDVIVDAALAIVEETGADALTMRRVADRLGVAAASLYGHVANKEELIQLLLDRVFGEMEVPDREATDWQAEGRHWLHECRRVLRRHPGVAGLTLGRIPLGVNSLVRMEALLAIIRRAGLPDQEAAYVGDLFGLYLGAFVHEEDMMAKSAAGQSPEDFAASFKDWLSALPAEQFPNMVALAGPLAAGSVDERFEWGLDVMLRGLATFIPPSRSRRKRRAE
ncbi:MAG TPA: TetR/AcrR family transcriptional regulator [Acidimicrobiales bacterium]|nr:TetR/AcrR family transcriptional regulator [Acidimicrobiales bacterium]